MTSYMYVFYRYYDPHVEEYSTFEEALQNFVSDFNNGEAYGIGVYDKETKTLYVPEFRKSMFIEQGKREMQKLGLKIASIETFDWDDQDG